MKIKKNKGQKKIKRKAIRHLKEDITYYGKEADQDRKNIKVIKKSKIIPKKRLIKHLKGDQKGFREEIKGDNDLISKLKRKK